MSTLKITKANFEAQVLQSKVPVLLDFWAPWCGPCRMIAPQLEALALETEGKALVGKVNVDEEMELAQSFGVVSIPMIAVVKDGQVINKAVGFRDQNQLRSMLGV